MSRLDNESDEEFRKRHMSQEQCVSLLYGTLFPVLTIPMETEASQDPPRTDAELGDLSHLESEIVRLARERGLKVL